MSLVLNSISTIAAMLGKLLPVKNAQKSEELLSALKASAALHSMNIERISIWKNRGLAIDKNLGKLIYAEHDGNDITHELVDISTLRSCEIIKHYATSTDIADSSSRYKKHLSSIDLQLRINGKDNRKFLISFYNEKLDKVSEMKALFQKAWHWKRLILR